MIAVGYLFERRIDSDEMLQEFVQKRYTMTRQKALNRRAGMDARKFAPASLIQRYHRCRELCSKMKDQIQRYRGRGMAMARREMH